MPSLQVSHFKDSFDGASNPTAQFGLPDRMFNTSVFDHGTSKSVCLSLIKAEGVQLLKAQNDI